MVALWQENAPLWWNNVSIIYLYYISADPGESQPDEVTNGDITQDIGTTLGCEVKQQVLHNIFRQYIF